MSKSILAKAALIACSAITLGALSITAAAEAKAFNPLDDADKATYSDLTLATDKTNIIGGRVECAAGDTVTYPIYVSNNSGFAATGLKVTYKADLELVMDGDTPKGELGEVAKDLMPVFADNSTGSGDPIVGVGTIGMMKNATGDGEAFLVDFKVPADAKPGTVYPMVLEIKDWKDNKTNVVDAVAFDGWIKIAGEEETTTTVVTTTTVPATTTTVVTTTKPATTTVPTTTTVAPTTTTAPIATGTTTTVNGTTTAEGTTSTAAATTTKKASGGSSSGSNNGGTAATKTGDAGVGVAAAALLLAAGTAVVATKKKKD